MTSAGMKVGGLARPFWPLRRVDRMVFSRGLALHDCWERIFCRAKLLISAC
jgi:hypothetical protein